MSGEDPCNYNGLVDMNSYSGQCKYNGRVDTTNYSGGVPFELHQNMGVNQNSGFTDSIKNIHNDNDLSRQFFSRINIDYVQEQIIKGVLRLSGDNYKIGKQSEEALEIVMRAMYLQHGKNLPCKIHEQVAELNKHVLEFCLPNIMTNIKQYVGYLDDLKKPMAVMENPIDTSNRNNQLENNIGFINFQKSAKGSDFSQTRPMWGPSPQGES
jgi:hypothetical protein